jgi:hypothetical protein
MGKRGNFGPGVREQVAEEAARLIRDHGIQDYGLAKRKAAARFGVTGSGALPRNSEIEARVLERQRIFDDDEDAARLDEMRRLAAELMDLFAAFRPRLAGAVLAGAITISSGIELHLFTDTPEDIVGVLQARGHSIRNCQRRFRFHGQEVTIVPGFRFKERGEDVYALVFPEKGLRQAPMSPVDGRPMRRADRGKLLELLEQSAGSV